MSLPAAAQRFLAACPTLAARVLGDEHHRQSLRESWSGAYGRDIYCYQVLPNRAGLGWAAPGEPHTTSEWPNVMTWTQMRAHRDAQPASLRAALDVASHALAVEHRRNWDACHAINPHGYCTNVPEQRAALDAENRRYWAEDRRLLELERAAVLAMLPLADDQPADLIEWAEALA